MPKKARSSQYRPKSKWKEKKRKALQEAELIAPCAPDPPADPPDTSDPPDRPDTSDPTNTSDPPDTPDIVTVKETDQADQSAPCVPDPPEHPETVALKDTAVSTQVVINNYLSDHSYCSKSEGITEEHSDHSYCRRTPDDQSYCRSDSLYVTERVVTISTESLRELLSTVSDDLVMRNIDVSLPKNTVEIIQDNCLTTVSAADVMDSLNVAPGILSTITGDSTQGPPPSDVDIQVACTPELETSNPEMDTALTVTTTVAADVMDSLNVAPDILSTDTGDSTQGPAAPLHVDVQALTEVQTSNHEMDTPLTVNSPDNNAVKLKDVLSDCVTALNASLPKHWKACEDDGAIQILKYSPDIAKVVQRSIYLNEEYEITLSFHGKQLPREIPLYQEADKLNFRQDSGSELAKVLCEMVGKYRLFEVCSGVPKVKFRSLWHREQQGFIDLNHFKETRYTETLRSKQCHYAVPQLQRQCRHCSLLQKRFGARKLPSQSPSGRVKTPSKYKSIADMITPEKEARLRRWTKVILNLKRQNERLKQKLTKAILEDGVEVDRNLDVALTESLQEADKKNKLTDFHKLFLQQQLKASQVKGSKGMRWHPLMIRFAVQLKMVSSVAYATMAKSGFIKLPGVSTLFDYTNAVTIKEGIHHEIVEEVAKSVDGLDHAYQRNHVLIFDEMAICQGIVQRRSTGQVIGYCNLNTVQQEIMELEKLTADLAEEVPHNPPKSAPLVKKMLSFMVKGTASGVQSVIASFGVSSLSKEDLHNYTWDVIGHLEMAGLQICAVICDGCPINRGFINMQPPHSKDAGIVYDTVNTFAPHRLVYFLSDPPHLLKTIRNCFYNSGRKACRNLKKGGEFLHWNTIVQLFKLKSKQTVKKLFKLSAPCVYLNSYSRMKVAYATRVISNSVAEVLSDLKWPNSAQLSIFKHF